MAESAGGTKCVHPRTAKPALLGGPGGKPRTKSWMRKQKKIKSRTGVPTSAGVAVVGVEEGRHVRRQKSLEIVSSLRDANCTCHLTSTRPCWAFQLSRLRHWTLRVFAAFLLKLKN